MQQVFLSRFITSRCDFISRFFLENSDQFRLHHRCDLWVIYPNPNRFLFHLEVQVWYPTRAAWSWSGVVPSMMWETWAIDKFFPKGAACCHPWDLCKQNCLACIDTHLGVGSNFTASQLPSVTETLDVQLQHTSATWTENMLHHLTNIDFIHLHVQVGQRLAGWSKLESLITVSRKASRLDQVHPHSFKPFALYTIRIRKTRKVPKCYQKSKVQSNVM